MTVFAAEQIARSVGRLRAPPLSHFIFLSGGAYNAAIARMLLAISLWMSIDRVGSASSWDYYVASLSYLGWHPKGLVKLTDIYFDGPPPQAAIVALYLIGKCSIALMFAGLCSRVSTVVAAISTTLYCSYMTSFGVYWSHAFNVQLLAALAFMFGRSGDALSIDALLRRAFNRPSPLQEHDGKYWWPVIFAELATHMFMFGAFYQKFTLGDGVWWAWSDNLRNSIALTWGLHRYDPPALAVWVMDNAWVYKTAGTLQLIAQFSTIFCIFLVRRPVARMIVGGSFFFLEIVGLSKLFLFWHPFWVPLCLLSVDWEWIASTVKQKVNRLRSSKPSTTSTPLSSIIALPGRIVSQLALYRNAREIALPRKYRTAVYVLMAGFFGYYTANIVFRLGEKHLNYPFSTMGFYAENRDPAPWDVPGWYITYRGHVEITLAGETEPVKFREMASDVNDRLMVFSTTEAEMKALAESIRTRLMGMTWDTDRGHMSKQTIKQIKAYRQIAGVPPRPRPATPLIPIQSGLLFVDNDQGFRGVDSNITWDATRARHIITVTPFGFKSPQIKMLTREDVRQNPRETPVKTLRGQLEGSDKFVVEPVRDGKFHFTLIEVTDPVLGVKELYVGPENFQAHQ